jgi:hypothetical protein
MLSSINHKIKKRDESKDIFYTPLNVVKIHLSLIDFFNNDKWLDPFYGEGIYYNNFPSNNKEWCEILKNKDFFDYNNDVDIICSNPPYSIFDKVIEKSIELKPRIISYLININNLTTKRIEIFNNAGYGLKKIHMTKIYKWFGMSYIVVFEKGVQNCITYDRIIHK